MKIKDNNNNSKDMSVHSGGYLYYNGKNISDQIEELTTYELAIMNIKTDKNGNRYVQKGGQKKLFIDNAKLTNKNNMLVKDYLSTQNEYEVTFTFKLKTTAPDSAYAENRAFDELANKILSFIPSNTKVNKI